MVTNPSQLVTPPAFVCVCVCAHSYTKRGREKRREKNTGRLALAKMVDGSVLVLDYSASLLPPHVCVCVLVHVVVRVLKIIHEDMPQYLLGKWTRTWTSRLALT